MRTLLLLALVACSGSSEPEPTPAPAPVPEPVAAPEPTLVPPQTGRFAASHILITHADAAGSPGATRSLDEARTLAASVREQALAGADFSALAAEHSADPSGVRGGSIGVFEAGTMMPTFEAAVASVEPGAIAPLAETPWGVHVVRRDAVVEGRFRHIVVGYAGAVESSATRTEVEARAAVEAAIARLDAGEDWAAVARGVSEDALASSGGDLGVVAPGQMVPAFDEAAFALTPGERSGPVTTPYGVHLIERY